MNMLSKDSYPIYIYVPQIYVKWMSRCKLTLSDRYLPATSCPLLNKSGSFCHNLVTAPDMMPYTGQRCCVAKGLWRDVICAVTIVLYYNKRDIWWERWLYRSLPFYFGLLGIVFDAQLSIWRLRICSKDGIQNVLLTLWILSNHSKHSRTTGKAKQLSYTCM